MRCAVAVAVALNLLLLRCRAGRRPAWLMCHDAPPRGQLFREHPVIRRRGKVPGGGLEIKKEGPYFVDFG